MSFETLQIFSTVSYILAAIMFVVAVVLFFVLRVPKLFGYITGLNARKTIANIHSQNENIEDNEYNPSSGNDKYSSVNNQARRNNSFDTSVGTEKLKSSPSNTPEDIHSDKQNKPSDSRNSSAGETVILAEKDYASGTTVLNESSTSDFIFTIESEVGFLGSSEFIE